MAKITTVLGPIEPQDLGFTSMHEHTVCDMSVFRRRFEPMLPPNLPVAADDPLSLDNLGILKHAFILARDVMDLRDEALIAAELADFRAAGGKALVDMSTPGIRTDAAALHRISSAADVHIIATTGLYSEDSWPEEFRSMTLEGYQAFMRKEIEEGIEGTAVRAGHIKIAITDSTIFTAKPFSERQQTVLKAAIRVSNETGLSLSVHPPLDTEAAVREVVRVMRDAGVVPERAVIAHQDLFFVCRDLRTLILKPESWRLSTDLARELLDQGFNLSIDSFGHYHDGEPIGAMNPTDWQRMAGLAALLQAGYASQLVLGTDVFLKILTRRGGGEGYCRLANFVVPTLGSMGIPEADIRKLTIENPARILAH